MEVELTDNQRAFDAVRDALKLWADRERRRTEILAAVDLADASCDRSERTVITTAEEIRQLAADIKRRGAAAQLDPLLAASGATEDELVNEIKEARHSRRKDQT